MPVYYGEKYIRQALKSLLNQTYKYFGLIHSDNALTDKTKKICEEYAKREKRIKYIGQKENMGVTNSFKFVLEQAKRARQRNKNAYKISPYGINLPCGMNMTKEKVGYVCEALKCVLGVKQ